jgi:hypothetical protein
MNSLASPVAVREQQRRAAVGALVKRERDGGVDPIGRPVDHAPEDPLGRVLDDAHDRRRVLAPEEDLERRVVSGVGVSVPPALDALLGGDEVVDALGRGVDGEAMKDVRHGCSSGRVCL